MCLPNLGVKSYDRDLDEPVMRTETGRLDIDDDWFRKLREHAVHWPTSAALRARGGGRQVSRRSPLRRPASERAFALQRRNDTITAPFYIVVGQMTTRDPKA